MERRIKKVLWLIVRVFSRNSGYICQSCGLRWCIPCEKKTLQTSSTGLEKTQICKTLECKTTVPPLVIGDHSQYKPKTRWWAEEEVDMDLLLKLNR